MGKRLGVGVFKRYHPAQAAILTGLGVGASLLRFFHFRGLCPATPLFLLPPPDLQDPSMERPANFLESWWKRQNCVVSRGESDVWDTPPPTPWTAPLDQEFGVFRGSRTYEWNGAGLDVHDGCLLPGHPGGNRWSHSSDKIDSAASSRQSLCAWTLPPGPPTVASRVRPATPSQAWLGRMRGLARPHP